MNSSIRKYLAELIGTFTLVFVGTSVAVLQGLLDYGDAGALMISLAFGGTLTVLVLVIGPVSGCHVNPAVTVPMALSGRMPWADVPGYLIGQFIGAVAASAVLLALMSGFEGYSVTEAGLGANGNPKNIHIASLFGWELVMTALFLLVIFSATRSGAPSIAAPLAIGGFLFVAHLVGAPIGDASLNPARSFGPAVLESAASLELLWLFIVAPLIGGVIGWLGYLLLYSEG